MITTFSLHIRISNHFFINNMVGRRSLCLELVKTMHERMDGLRVMSFLQYFSYIVVLLFYVHSAHLRSCRDGQLT